MELATDEIRSPIGTIVVVTGERGLCALDFDDCRERMTRLLRRHHGEVTLEKRRNPRGVSTRVRAYLEGRLDALDDITVDAGGTDFQRTVWAALREIPCGARVSYADIAGAIGKPKAARAVGAANGQNPVALVVPCHRVVAADGKLAGYAGGMKRKEWLLEHEQREGRLRTA